jgi:hypothetical protein
LQNFGKAPDTSKTRAAFDFGFLFERALAGQGLQICGTKTDACCQSLAAVQARFAEGPPN